MDRVAQNQAFPVTALIEQALPLGDPVGPFRISGDWIDVARHEPMATEFRWNLFSSGVEYVRLRSLGFGVV